MKVVFASTNPKKAQEISRMLPKDLKILYLGDFPCISDIAQVDETGATFEENALIKAHYWAKILNLPVLSEDSGLMIDALGGYPGVATHRCISELAPNADINIDSPDEVYPLLLSAIATSCKRTTDALWVSSIAYVDPVKCIELASTAILEGNMCPKAGEKVFGFDQYFRPKGWTITLSQMTSAQKDSIGPRRKALHTVLKSVV